MIASGQTETRRQASHVPGLRLRTDVRRVATQCRRLCDRSAPRLVKKGVFLNEYPAADSLVGIETLDLLKVDETIELTR
jgi:hypothetical protein